MPSRHHLSRTTCQHSFNDYNRKLSKGSDENLTESPTVLQDASTLLNQLIRKKSDTSFNKTIHKKKPTEDIFSSTDHIDKKIRHCLQLAEDTLNANGLDDQEYPEFVNPWASSQSDFEQDQAFIDYLDELDGSISEDKLWKNRQN